MGGKEAPDERCDDDIRGCPRLEVLEGEVGKPVLREKIDMLIELMVLWEKFEIQACFIQRRKTLWEKAVRDPKRLEVRKGQPRMRKKITICGGKPPPVGDRHVLCDPVRSVGEDHGGQQVLWDAAGPLRGPDVQIPSNDGSRFVPQ